MAGKDQKEKKFSRRDFLKTTGAATGGIIGGSLLGGSIGMNFGSDTSTGEEEAQQTEESGGEESGGTENPGRLFFHNDADFETISQAMERIFPEDDLGPGAIKLGVPYFLDLQLDGAYGNNSKEYMQGPFHEGETTQGYQSRLTRAELFTLGIEALNNEAQNDFDNDFASIEDDQKDEILTKFEDGDADLGIPRAAGKPEEFFRLLRSATLQGAYADPMYRGNRGMEGWKMKNFPGHQHAYIQQIDTDSFQEIEPQSLYGGK
ncbi:MAG TPA: gluconate 2-dehydrogenase subunit 3 family protein [Candidatus Salinicoccus stercoripullorum]|uniref:Gluconate 2-dehydrogenase subunit 3 family protein n=1 Tax=Candidatus Salinicoccus stercoripullorum TaxID=2838756 RepID=A0A9D1TZT3_9STAP|nr:gluconate 2-dehydrogenase subunit 3 family protein [Candidatus Salinicoccus stercoripullorum]